MSNLSSASGYIEPVFYFGLKKHNPIPDDLSPGRADVFFEYSIKQNPRDLSRHLQRIQYALSHNDQTGLFAALCDLFIILGTLGRPLRQRLLHISKSRLDAQQAQLLLRHTYKDQLGNDFSDLPENSLFRKQAVELIDFSCLSKAVSLPAEDLLHTADSYIENSQFDEALDHLAKHLEQDPDNEALTLKLIELLKALNNADEFDRAYARFANNLLTAQHWDNARIYFAEQS